MISVGNKVYKVSVDIYPANFLSDRVVKVSFLFAGLVATPTKVLDWSGAK